MFAKKTIWYGRTPPLDADKKPIVNAVFDKRVLKIPMGTDMTALDKEDDVKVDEGIAKRMLKSGFIVEKLDPQLRLLIAQKQAEADADAEAEEEKDTDGKEGK